MIRIGVIGAGYWGPLHVRTFDSLPDCRVEVVADLNVERRRHIASLYPAIATTDDAGSVMAADLDAIVISTPAQTHAALARQALSCGKHVLVEKPLTTCSADAEHLIELARERGRVLMVGHTFMYHGAVRALRDIVRAGDLGRVLYIDSTRVNLGLHRKDVDVVWDLGAHDVSILRFLLDADPLDVVAHGAAYHVADVAEVAYVGLRYASGILANSHLSWLDPVKARRLTVVGDRRMALWDDLEPVEKLRVFDRGMVRRPYHDDFGQWQVAYRDGGSRPVPFDFEEPLRLMAAEFCRAIRLRDEPFTSATQGLAVVQTLEAISRVLRLGSPVAGAAAWS